MSCCSICSICKYLLCNKMENFKTQIVMDFGSVYMNSNHSKWFEVENSSSINQIFKIEQCCERPKLDSGFRVTPYVSPQVKPGESFKFKVEFTPKVPNFKCGDYFNIEHLNGHHCTIFTKASVKGPECSLSCSQMKLICSSDKKKAIKKFEIRNNGGCIVHFQFTIDNNNSCVIIQPSQGCILPSKSSYITVIYAPASHVTYFKRIYCLVTNHDPISLDIYGIWPKKNENSILNLVNVPTDRKGHHCFMNDVMSAVKRSELPMVSLDTYTFDFGHCPPKKQKQLTFSITNNSIARLSVIWNQAVKEGFKVQPIQSELDSNSTATFSAVFKPSVKDLLYGVYLEAQLHTIYPKSSNQPPVLEAVFPLPIEINLKGHTFDETSCGWSAQYKVEPTRLLLPPCTSRPFHPSYSTLTIHRLGHLPLAFRFHPPTLTNFSVKPEQGIIREHFQIVVVQFYPKKLNDAVYTEKWMLTFNSNENVNQCIVEFEATVETPNIIVNGGQDVVFPKVHPGTLTDLFVDLYNPTRFPFQYNLEILKGDPVLILEKEGEIWPHEHKQVPWYFHPAGQGELEAVVSCTPLMNSVGVRSTTAIVRAVCEETELQVEPSEVVFQQVMRDYQHERGFQLINNGEATIRGEFTWDCPACEDNCARNVIVRLEPLLFDLEPGASINVSVYITPLERGAIDITIGHCQNGVSASPLIPVAVDCVFPRLEVTDLRHSNTGPLFSRFDFWRFLRIKTLNEVLRNVSLGKNEGVHMSLPSYLCTNEDITVELLLENKSAVGVNLILAQKVTCGCKPVVTAVSFSRSRLVDNCPHKGMVKITPTSANIKADGFLTLNITVSYTTVGHMESVFVLSLTPEDFEELGSSLELKFTRTSIPENVPFIDTIEHKENNMLVFNMRPVFIGDYYPYVQIFVLYNNTKHSVNYDIDDGKLYGTPFKYVGNRKEIDALSHHALMFTFLPHSCKTYEAEIKLLINNTTMRLVLRGTGVNHVVENSEENDLMFPRRSKLMSLSPSPLHLSVSHLDLGPVKPCSTQRHVLFINNKTEDIISFKWRTSRLPNVFELRVHPAMGAIQPGGSVECRLVGHCRSWPHQATVSVTCVFASFSKYSSMVQAIHKYREDVIKSSDYFIITQEGFKTVELAPPVEDWPKKNYLTISVTMDVKEYSMGDNFLPISQSSIYQAPSKELAKDPGDGERILITFILEKILWEALNEKCDQPCTESNAPDERYIQIKDTSAQGDEPVPRHLMQKTAEDILYSVWKDVLQLTSRNSAEELRKTLLLQLKSHTPSLTCSQDGSNKIFPYQSMTESYNQF